MKLLTESEPVMATAPMGAAEPAGLPWLPPFNPPALMVLAGFRDCAEEALRYLSEVEQMPASDPLYTKLRDFLLERERALDVTSILSEADCSLPDLQPPHTPHPHPQHQQHQPPQPCLSPLPAGVVSLGMDCGAEGEGREVTGEGNPNVQPYTQVLDCVAQTVAQTVVEEEEECPAPLSLLPPVSQCAAHSADSAIRSLANELLALLQEEAMATDDDEEDEEEEEDYIDEDELSCEMNDSVEETVDQ